jgi:hypothetical protein
VFCSAISHGGPFSGAAPTLEVPSMQASGTFPNFDLGAGGVLSAFRSASFMRRSTSSAGRSVMGALRRLKLRMFYHVMGGLTRIIAGGVRSQARALEAAQKHQNRYYMAQESVEAAIGMAADYDSSQREKFHALIGMSISSWVIIEYIMIGIFVTLARCDLDVAGIVLYSNMNFGSWISMITEILALRTEQKENSKKWGKLAGELRALKDTRDRLAHDTTLGFLTDIPDKLAPSSWDVRSKSRRHKPLSPADIEVFLEEVTVLSIKLEHFCNSVADVALASSGKSRPQGNRPRQEPDAPEHHSPTEPEHQPPSSPE